MARALVSIVEAGVYQNTVVVKCDKVPITWLLKRVYLQLAG